MSSNVESMEGLDINEISGEKIRDGLIKAVKKRLNSDNVKLCIEHGSKKGALTNQMFILGDNYMGEIYRILYKDGNDENNNKQSSLILKIAPRNEIMREKLQSRELFLQEIKMYDNVLSFFYDFQLSKGIIPKENGFNESAKRYFSISEELSESLFLEDLRRRKFEMVSLRDGPIKFDHVRLVMQALGKFHAISFALKDQQPEKFKELSESIPEQFWTMIESKFSRHFEHMVWRLTSILEQGKRFDLLERFNRMAGEYHLHQSTVFKLASSSDSYSVICHGDATTNNTMFSNDDHGNPVEVTLFDWQFSRYASPVTDLLLYVFLSTTKELRDQHYEEFLNIYHASLSDLLKRLGSDPQKLFPFEALLDQFRKFGVYSIYVAAFLLPMVYCEPQFTPDIDTCVKADINDPKYKESFYIPDETRQAYNKRVTDIFEDLARLGYI